MRIGVTGSSGFIGRHLGPLLRSRGHEVILLTREVMANAETLAMRVAPCDAIIHLAGTNCGDDAHIHEVNVGLANALAAACRTASCKPHIVFASSVFTERPIDNPARSPAFGASKREAANILLEWAAENGSEVSVLFLPHVFGELAPPFHNSVVATFCHQLVRGEPSELRAGASVELLYVRDAVLRMAQVVEARESGEIRMPGTVCALKDVYELLRSQLHAYTTGALPDFEDRLAAALFLTLHYHILLGYLERRDNV